MALDIILKVELAHVLVGLVVATVQTSAAGGHPNTEHLDGALGMARSTALACGVRWQTVIGDARAVLDGDGLPGLLDQTRQLGA